MAQTVLACTALETNLTWESRHVGVLSSYCNDPNDGRSEEFAALSIPDKCIEENHIVSCPIIRPTDLSGGVCLERVCILLHGLNERSWEKYYPWAQAIADRSQCAVILFPAAFHMDRSPAAWGNFGVMRKVSKDRLFKYPNLRQSSMANAALSERLDRDPSRFFLSGLMGSRDLGDLIEMVRSGQLPGIAADATLGFFGYSAGAFLLQCHTLSDPAFAESGKRFIFCGGPFLSGMTPVSKFIMDSRAHERIMQLWVQDLAEELRNDPVLADLVDTPEGAAFCAMVDPSHPQCGRADRFSDGATRVVSLSGDGVMPKSAILDFFKDTEVEPIFFDLPPVCTHITPFDPQGGEAAQSAFDHLFDSVAEHLFG